MMEVLDVCLCSVTHLNFSLFSENSFWLYSHDISVKNSKRPPWLVLVSLGVFPSVTVSLKSPQKL